MASRTIPSRTAPPSKPPIPLGAPNKTLYVTNLPDRKIRKPDLRLSLYTLFSTYGPVLDVIALKTQKMRGQAHIVFRDVNASTQAMRSLQGFEFFGKQMKIAYAKGTSDTFAKLTGTWKGKEGAIDVGVSDVQRAVFGAPPGGGAELKAPEANDGGKSPQGVKRTREESEGEEDVPMDEDDDGDAPMEDSSDED